MSDVSQGPGWWLATDGKWYAPEQHPSYVVLPPLPPPPPAVPSAVAAPTVSLAAHAMPPPPPGTALAPQTVIPGVEASRLVPSGNQPIHKQWWCWAAAGVLVALSAVGAVSLVGPTATASKSPSSPGAGVTATAPSAAVTTAFNTLFDLSHRSVTGKLAVLEDGPSLKAAVTVALGSSLATSATGVSVQSVTVLPDSTCQSAQVSTPCAQVVYNILGANNVVLLPNSAGYAVEVSGQWLVSRTTACGLFRLLYQAQGKTSAVPGCHS
jgi:hypothetical protein